jgi:hypothetical protein
MLPYGITYFCDDIRFEQQNKFSLIGCYGPDIVLHQALPAIMPKFCALIQVRFPAEPRSPGKISIYLPEREPILISEWSEEKEYTPDEPHRLDDEKDKDLITQRAFLFPCIFSPFPISKEGHIKVRMEYRSEIIRLGAIQIIYKPDLTEPSPIQS